MIDPNNLTTDDARNALLSTLTTLEDAHALRCLDWSDDEDPETLETVRAIFARRDMTHHDPGHGEAWEGIADDIIEGAFLAIDPTGFRANGWTPDASSPLGVEYTIGVGGPHVWIESTLDDTGALRALTGGVAWGGQRVEWDAPHDIRARWTDVDPARAFIESIA